MEVHPGMSYYNDVQDGTALITKTLETTSDLTPLHIPPGPPVHPNRYEELRETFQLCKPVLKAGQEYGGSEPILPESHRIYEPPYKFDPKHHYYGSTQDAPPRLPDLPENSAEYMKYPKSHTRGTLLVEGRYRPFHPYVHSNVDIRGGPERNQDPTEVLTINRGDTEWPGQHGAIHSGEGNGSGYQAKASGTMAPKSAVKPPELDISRRAANMLENVKKALWLSTYKRDYTGRGSMNPLLLDDYNAKVIGRATGELGHDVELRELFPSETSQVRPLEGRIARYLQGREYHFADPQQKHYAEMQRLPLQGTDKPVAHAYSEGSPNAREVSLSTFPQCPIIESGVKKKTEHLLQNQNCPQASYQEENDQCKMLPFRKITDTWKIEKLYQRQLAVPPEPEVVLKPVDSIYYEDLKPSRFNNYIVWHHPVSLSKPAALDLTSKQHCDVPAVQFASNTKDVVTSSGFPEWIPNCGVPRPQTKLLDIQDSFRKCEAIKRLSDLTRGGIRDLRDHDRHGRRHQFHGMHAFLFS